MKESKVYVDREKRFDRLDSLPNLDCTGLMRQWDKPVRDKEHNERHEQTDKGAGTVASSQSIVAVRVRQLPEGGSNQDTLATVDSAQLAATLHKVMEEDIEAFGGDMGYQRRGALG